MQLLWKRFTDALVTRYLRFKVGAKLLIDVAGANTPTQVTLTELAKLSGLTASTAELNITDGLTATAAELNQAADNSVNTEVVTAANVIAAAESGATFILNSATGFASTLPAPAAGLRFKFIVGNTPPTSGNHTVVTNASANIIDGGATVAGADVPAADEDSINFVASTAIAGDQVELFSDGTNWYVNGRGTTAGSITFTAA